MSEDMNIVIVGHVDHGKSTIIGRLLADTNSLPKGKLEQIKEICKRNSKPFEYAFLIDALKEERLQGITIDTARCFFKTSKRNYIIIDAPGHLEFLKNMITGASRADAALLVVDAKEGIRENSKRHIHILSLLGIKQIAVLINKMDLVSYDYNTYINIVNELKDFFQKLNINAQEFIPISGINGDNIAFKSQYMDWYKGKIVLDTLDNFNNHENIYEKPFRMFVQDVYKFTKHKDDRRIVAGTVETGKLSVGDKVIFYPSGKKAKVKSIESFNKEKELMVKGGYATGFTLEEQIYIKRGDVVTLEDEEKMNVTTRIYTTLFWLSDNPMEKNKKYFLKIGTAKVGVKLEEVVTIINSTTLEEQKKEKIDKNDVAKCILNLDKSIAFDNYTDIFQTGRFVIVNDYIICGGGIIQKPLEDKITANNIAWHEGKVTYEERCKRLRQKGLVVWFTGISGSGKSTISVEVEKELFRLTKFVYRLDSDNLRYGLNCDLDFSKNDRAENVRRIAEVAELFKDAGFIVLVSCIAPYKEMREFVKQKIGKSNFIEVYVKANIQTCINRDPKGLYKKVKNKEIGEFTGITSPYEIPENPDLVIDTEKLSIEESMKKVLDLIIK